MSTSSALDSAESSAESEQPLLRAVDITFSYGSLQVLFGVSISVSEGETLALLGTNGAGKSTLLRVLSGLDLPSTGQVTFENEVVTGLRAEEMVTKGLVLIPGGRAVFPDMTVEENLRVQAFSIRRNRRRLAERRELVLETFPRLAQRLSQHAGNLSGGEQQQVALAKALLLDPKILCIDELSLGLAPIVVGELIEVICRIRRTGLAMILVDQSLNIAAELCDRAVFMEKGAVHFEGRTRDLLERDDIARAVFLGDK